MSAIPSAQPVTGLTDAARTRLLTRTGDRLAETRRDDLVLLDGLDQTAGTAALAGQAPTAGVSGSPTGSTLEVLGSSSDPVAVVTAGSSQASLTQSAASGTQTGGAISTDPLHVLPQQSLPGLIDTGDSVALLLGAGIVPSDLVGESEESLQNFPGGAPADPFSGIATADLLRPDLDSAVNERVAVIPAGVFPASVAGPEFIPPDAAVIPALPNQSLPQVNSGQSDLLNSFLRPSRDASNQQRQRRSTGLDS